MELVVTRNDKPQTVRGLLDVKFDKGLVVGGTFSSRWVDLDSWVGSGGDAPPKLNAALAGLASEFLRRASAVREGTIKLFLDQAVLAGDLATNVQMTLSAAADNKLEVSRLSARLPGDNKLGLEGSLARDEGGVVFKGPVSVSGTTLSGFCDGLALPVNPAQLHSPVSFCLRAISSPDRAVCRLSRARGICLVPLSMARSHTMAGLRARFP